MKTKIILGLLVCLLFGGCNNDDELSPSLEDVDWYRIEDDPNDPLTHLRYQIYSEEGVSVFFNDTLGSEIRYNKAGEPYTYYEVLKPWYMITGANRSALLYTLADDPSDVMTAVELLGEYLFGYLPREYRPLSYLVVDSAKVALENDAVYDDYYKAMTVTVVGNIEQMKDMTIEQKQEFAAELAALELLDVILDEDVNGEVINHYDTLSLHVNLTDIKDPNYYPDKLPRGGYAQVMNGSRYYTLPPAELFGFIHYRHQVNYKIYIPTKEQDKAAYIGLILRMTDAEIREKYADYPVVIEKYELMRAMMERVGLFDTSENADNS